MSQNAPDCISAHIHFKTFLGGGWGAFPQTPLGSLWPLATWDFSPKWQTPDRTLPCTIFDAIFDALFNAIFIALEPTPKNTYWQNSCYFSAIGGRDITGVNLQLGGNIWEITGNITLESQRNRNHIATGLYLQQKLHWRVPQKWHQKSHVETGL